MDVDGEQLISENNNERLAEKDINALLGIAAEDQLRWLAAKPEELHAVGNRSFENIRSMAGLCLEKLESRHHLDQKEGKDTLVKEVQRIKDKVFISVNVNPQEAMKIAREGSFISFDDLSTEEKIRAAVRHNSAGDIEGYLLRRKTVESSLRYGALPEGAVSGCLASPNGRSEIRGGAEIFGDLSFILDWSKVVPRATFTMGDSMNSSGIQEILGPEVIRGKDKPVFDRQLIVEHAVIAESILNIFKPLVVQGSAFRYVEALLYGGFTMDDIQELRVPSRHELFISRRGDSNLYNQYTKQIKQLTKMYGDKVKIVGR